MTVFDCNTSLVLNIIRHNMMRQTEIEISSVHGEMDAYWEEHGSDVVLAVCVNL